MKVRESFLALFFAGMLLSLIGVYADEGGDVLKQYQTTGLNGNLPVFYEQRKAKLDFPMSWTSGNYHDFDQWKQVARDVVLEKLIEVPAELPFNPVIIDEIDRGTYLGRKVVFDLTAESRVLGLMLVPKGEGPFPAVLLLHDHGSKFDIGKEKLIQPWGDPNREQIAQTWTDKYFSGRFIGDELAKRGYLVLAVDALGWGDRGTITYSEQQALASNLLNLGSSLAGLLAVEDIRSASFLSSLPEVDSQRVAALGFSLGSYRAWQVAALSDEIKAGVAICWIGTNQGLMVPGNNVLRGQSAFYMVHPGLAKYLDYPDVASIAAPKPMLFYNGGLDKLFPVESVQDAYDKMRKVWQSQGAGDRLETKLWPNLSHEFIEEQQIAVFDWLDQWLLGK